MATPGVAQLLTSTLANRHTKLADNVSNSNALLSQLKKKGRTRVVTGGSEIKCPLVYAEEDFKWYSGTDPLSRDLKETISEAKYEPAMAVSSITLTGEDMGKNQGREAIINLMSAKIENAERTLENQIGSGLYGDGSVPKSMVGLAAIIADDPTLGTIGGIDAATYPFWRNQIETLAVGAGLEVDFQVLTAAMRKLWRHCTRNREHPDLILSDGRTFEAYEAGLTQNQRYADEKMANSGFETLKFKNVNVVYEGDEVGHPGGMHFVNTDYFKFEPFKGHNFQTLDIAETTPDLNAITKHIGFMGGLTCSNRRMQGRLKIDYA